MAWIIFLLVLIPLVGLLAWALLDESFVRVEPGNLGLLLVRGKATDKALDPGVHFVPALRRRMVQQYPSLELSYRADDGEVASSSSSDLERGGPSLRVNLGDRSVARISYTLRFRLDQGRMKTVHNRFGPGGIWPAARDGSARTIRNVLTDPRFSVEDLFGTARQTLEAALSDALTTAFEPDGFVVTAFSLGDVDLGRTGEVIQATTRARYELAREEAETETRLARARNDAEIGTYLTGDSRDAALRYREVDVWRELVQVLTDRSLALPAPGHPAQPQQGPPTETETRPALIEPAPTADEQ